MTLLIFSYATWHNPCMVPFCTSASKGRLTLSQSVGQTNSIATFRHIARLIEKGLKMSQKVYISQENRVYVHRCHLFFNLMEKQDFSEKTWFLSEHKSHFKIILSQNRLTVRPCCVLKFRQMNCPSQLPQPPSLSSKKSLFVCHSHRVHVFSISRISILSHATPRTYDRSLQ